jgi:hypothetical protein
MLSQVDDAHCSASKFSDNPILSYGLADHPGAVENLIRKNDRYERHHCLSKDGFTQRRKESKDAKRI